MKRYGFIIVVMLLALALFGCAKKEPGMEEPQEIVSMETVTTMAPTGPAAAEPKAAEVKSEPSGAVSEPVQLPVPGPAAKPTALEIQTALKNANVYSGEIDGKIGPQTKEAIREFQRVNGLQVDGKVGPKTWAVLSGYLNPSEKKAGKKR
jgi:murein L,D-transpeptidase YcbB/YkuD